MYQEIEQGDNVARGCIDVKEIIAYRKGGAKRYFCQTNEQEVLFNENNPDVRTELFSIQLLKSSAVKYLDDPENAKQFKKRDLIKKD